MKNRFVYIIAVGVLCSAVFACKKDSAPPRATALKPFEILLDWQAEPTYLGVYYAKALGLYEKLGLDVAITQSWGANQAVAAVAAGKYSIATASGGATVLGHRGGAEIVSLAVIYPKVPTVVYGLAQSKINVPKDLEGKRIGIYPGSITQNEFDAFVVANNLDRDKLRIESLSGPDIPLLLAGKLDAVLHYTEMSPVLVEGNSSVPVVDGKRTFEIRLSEHGVDGYGLNVVTSRARLRENPELLKAISGAMVEGYVRGCENPAAAVTAFMKYFPDKDRGYVERSWKRVCSLLGDEPGSQNIAGWDTTIGVYRRLGLVGSEVQAKDILP
jgi:NitT/TauT family transport system substrate-binding protein